MGKSRVFLIIGIVMLAVMILFVAYALQHPEGYFAGGYKIALPIYFIYLVTTIGMFALYRAAARKLR
ncbi:MAG: hypothetical protein K0R84_1625 [Clostridia bacterium]|jgi:hypothetical protein|nr:hypothetical protein [Clostridia bacterium]